MRASSPEPDPPRVSVCVPATRAESVGATVAAVRRQTWPDWELLVLGQGAPEPIEAAVQRAARGDSRVRFVHLSSRGLSRARNASLAHARGSILAFTDDDCEPLETWLAAIVTAFDHDARLGLVGGAVLAPARLGLLTTCPTVSPSEALYEPTAASRRPPDGWDWIGANFAVRRDLMERFGKFDEHLGAGSEFPAAEDTDYKLRLEAGGVRMLTTPRAAVVHTYGVRRGWRAMLRSQRNYATGNGAMAGKLTLMGDGRGREWLEQTRRECAVELKKPLEAFRRLRRLRHFQAAYRRCVEGYVVAGGCLRPVAQEDLEPAGHAPIQAGRARP